MGAVRRNTALSFSSSRLALTLLFLSITVSYFSTAVQKESGYLRQVRTIRTASLGISQPRGISFSPLADAFFVLTVQPADQPGNPALTHLAMLSLHERLVGADSTLSARIDPLNVTIDTVIGRLIAFDPTSKELLSIPLEPTGMLNPALEPQARFATQALSLQRPQGMTFDPATGRLFILDTAGPRIISLTLDAERGIRDVAMTELGALDSLELRGLAFNANTGHFYLLSLPQPTLYEVTEIGQVLMTRDLSTLSLANPQAMTFASSGDTTDDPQHLHLYITDAGRTTGDQPRQGQITEVELTEHSVTVTSVETINASLVQVIKTSEWSPPSPDPTGITYLPDVGRLLVVDSEVEEMASYYAGKNVFEATVTGRLVETHDTTSFSREPTGITIDPINNQWFISDDIRDLISVINLGPDRRFGTEDDSRTKIDTDLFGSYDPEGLAFGRGKLYLVDGYNQEAYIIDPGPNGRFDNLTPVGDDIVTHFDTGAIGQPDPEGIEYNPVRDTLYIISNDSDTHITETTITGVVVGVINISALDVDSPGELALAPGSEDPDDLNIYIVERGIDNKEDPSENDGLIYEATLADDDDDPTVTFTPRPTLTPTGTPSNFILFIPMVINN